MSKMDGLRAMREARHAEMQKRAGAATKKSAAQPPVAPAGAAKRRVAKTAAVAPAPVAAETDELCGHRNMSGRSCTRERGHAAKSHRYS